MFILAVQIISSLLVALRVYLLYKQLKESNKWNKIQASIAMINRYNILINEIDDALLDEIKLLSFENKDFSLDETKRIFDNLSNGKQLFCFAIFSRN